MSKLAQENCKSESLSEYFSKKQLVLRRKVQEILAPLKWLVWFFIGFTTAVKILCLFQVCIHHVRIRYQSLTRNRQLHQSPWTKADKVYLKLLTFYSSIVHFEISLKTAKFLQFLG